MKAAISGGSREYTIVLAIDALIMEALDVSADDVAFLAPSVPMTMFARA
jgi:hypothetical protein